MKNLMFLISFICIGFVVLWGTVEALLSSVLLTVIFIIGLISFYITYTIAKGERIYEDP